MNMTQVSDELDMEMYRTNVLGYHFVTKMMLPLLQKAPLPFERTIINVTSGSGWLTNPPVGRIGMVGYRVSKAAQNSLTLSLHQVYAAKDDGAAETRGGPAPQLRIARIVSVHPGRIATGLGLETLHTTLGVSTHDELAQAKALKFGSAPVEEGADGIVWAAAAEDGEVISGSNYWSRTRQRW